MKGQASDAQRRLVTTVRKAQLAAIQTVKAGRSGHAVHQAATSVFEFAGYKTERRGDKFVGFIHSTGHGLGSDVHEVPVAPNAETLQDGHVVTIEPGLYYPEIEAVGLRMSYQLVKMVQNCYQICITSGKSNEVGKFFAKSRLICNESATAKSFWNSPAKVSVKYLSIVNRLFNYNI